MKIGFDAKRAFNNKTGLGNYSRYILKNLIESSIGNEIYAYTPKVKKGFFSDFPEAQIKIKKKKYPDWYWRSYGVIKQLKKDNISLFHGLSNEIPIGLQEKKIRSVVSIHDLIFLRYPNYYPFLDRQFYETKFKYASKNSDKIIAISQQTKNDIMEFYSIPENKIEVIYQSCSSDFKPAKEIDNAFIKKYEILKPYIVAVGTIEERKNQLSLIKAFENEKFKDFELIIIGNGRKYKEEVLKYINSNGIKNVRILDNINQNDLIKFYQNAEFSAYISLFEGFGIPVLESISVGKPVLASDNLAIMEAGGKCALYIDPLSIDSIETGLNDLFFNSATKTKLMENRTNHLAQFDNKKLTSQLIDLYNSIDHGI